MGSQNRTLLTTLIQDAVLKLCTQNVKFDTSLEIDGIICITPGNVEKEIVIKMHRTIMKSATDPDPQWQGADYSQQMAGQYQGDIATPPAAKRRQKPHSNSPQVTPSKVVDPNSFSSDVRSNISFDEMPSAKVEPGGDYDTGYTTAETYATHPYGATSQTQYEQRTPSRKRKSTSNTDTTQSEEKSIKVEPQAEIMIEDDSSSYPADGAGDTSGADYDTGQQEDSVYGNKTGPPEYGTMDSSYMMQATMQQPPSLSQIFTEHYETSTCNICEKVLPTGRCMDYHTMVAHNGFCEVCNQRLDHEANPLEHARQHVPAGNKKAQCKECYKLFGTEAGLATHLACHVKCNMCGKVLNKPHRTYHLKTVHGWKK